MDFRKRSTWVKAGWIATFLWIVFVWETTGGSRAHPLFDYIFLAPLGLWLAGILLMRRLVKEGSVEDDRKKPGAKR